VYRLVLDGGSGQANSNAQGRFRRRPATGPLQERRRQWGREWGAINRELAKALRAERG